MVEAYGSTDDGEFDTWTAMDVVTQETRASLVADIVGHPEGMPSVPELDHVNPDVERSAITEHLEKLRAAGLIGKTEIPVGERSRDLPHVFYYVTDAGRAFFDRNDIFDEDLWREQYAKVQKPPEIGRIEEMERPERD